jgi:VWFA-related protein
LNVLSQKQVYPLIQLASRVLNLESRIFSVLILVFSGWLFPALYPQDQPSFSVEVDVVPIIVTVRDKDGQLVTNLVRKDFILEEEERLQEIEYFVKEADLPLTLGLLVDSSMSQRTVLEEERKASFQFLQQVLRPDKDQVFVISFDVDVELLQDPTNDLGTLRDSLDEVQLPHSQGRRQQIGTVLYDAVFLSADEIMHDQSGRKALILLSDGVEFRSILDSDDAIEATQRSDTIIYGIRYYDDRSYSRGRGGMGGGGWGRPGRFPGGGPGGIPGRNPGGWGGDGPRDGEEVLKELTEETGGSLFEVTKKLSLSQIFDQIEAELRSQYILGYRPTGDSNGYRRIQVKTKDKSLSVRSRAGYYP